MVGPLRPELAVAAQTRASPMMHITGLKRISKSEHDSDASNSETWSGSISPSWTGLHAENLVNAVTEMGYATPTTIRLHRLDASVTVVAEDQSASYDAFSEQGLCIREDQSMVDWWAEYNAANETSKVKQSTNTLGAHGTSITLHQTLRVPDDGKKHALPPSLGDFPLFPIENYKDKLPPAIVARGGFITPMYQREALWISFDHHGVNHWSGGGNAVKVSVGGVNALTGLPKNIEGEAGQQDYLCARQPWLDGIAKEPGVVRQFVAVDIDDGFTIEEQLTGKNSEATLQFDIFPRYKKDIIFKDSAGKQYMQNQLYDSPAAAGLQVGDEMIVQPEHVKSYDIGTLSKLHGSALTFSAHYGPKPTIFVKTITSKVLEFETWGEETISDMKALIREREGIPEDQQRLIFSGKQLDDERCLSDYGVKSGDTLFLVLRLRGGGGGPDRSMGIAAGGRIRQEIIKDHSDIRCYNQKAATRIMVHAINAAAWKSITGENAPISPVNQARYYMHGLPWFEMYNEPKSLKQLGRGFVNVQSINDLDEQEESYGLRSGKKRKTARGPMKEEDFARWRDGNEGLIIDLNADNVSPLRQ